jgi:hypothetical protein
LNANESKLVADYVSDQWPGCTITSTLWDEFRRRIETHPHMPVRRALEVVNDFRWKSKYKNPDLPDLERELGLAARQCQAGIARQNSQIDASRAARLAEPEDATREHEAAREFVRGLTDAQLLDLRDRVLRRSSKFVRLMVTDNSLGDAKRDAQLPALDWSDRDAVLSRLWVCMGLWMEHTGVNRWAVAS